MPYDEFVALGETKHHEYYDDLVVVTPPSRRHVTVASRLTRVLQDARPPEVEVLAEWGWQAGPRIVFEPDIMAFRADAPGPDILREPPLLVVEVLSPSTRSEDLGRKRELYAAAGAQWYWLVDPLAESVTVLRNTGGSSIQVLQQQGPGRLILDEPFRIELDLVELFAA